MSIWGTFAMLTSAPFDDWWHNTYGLDVTILSPPHTVLLLGMITIQLGAIVSVVAYQNLDGATMTPDTLTRFTWLFGFSSGFMVAMLYTMASEYLSRHDMHGVLFYEVASLIFPLFLVAFSVASTGLSAGGITLTPFVATQVNRHGIAAVTPWLAVI